MGLTDYRESSHTPLRGNTQPQDELFAQLAHPMRRRVLAAVALTSPHDPHDPLTCDSITSESTMPERDRVELHHVHLPKLAYAGYVDWDPSAEAIRPGPAFEDIAPAIDLLLEHGEVLPGSWR